MAITLNEHLHHVLVELPFPPTLIAISIGVNAIEITIPYALALLVPVHSVAPGDFFTHGTPYRFWVMFTAELGLMSPSILLPDDHISNHGFIHPSSMTLIAM